MKNQIKLKRPSREDLPLMKTVLKETDLFPPEMLDEMIEPFFAEASPASIWLVIEVDGKLCGLAYCEPERMTDGTYNLLAIAVGTSSQGQGFGEKLVAELEGILSQKKARVLLVETMGTPAFELTRKFYVKNGFTKEAQIRDFYESGGDKIVFWKSLTK